MKIDESDISYITALIKKEIKEKPSKEINEKVQKIDQLGLQDENYLDKELIFLLSVHEESTNIVKSILNEELESLDKKEKELLSIQEKENELTLKIKDIKKAKRKINLKRMVKKVLVCLSFGVVGIGMMASIRKAEELGKTKVFQTLSTSYDSSLPDSEQEEPVEEWLEEDSSLNTLSIVEYSPWEEPGYFRNDYTRNVYTYTLTDASIFYENARDYLNPEIKEKLTVSPTIEYSPEKPNEDYTENKYVVKQKYQNKEVFDYVQNGVWKSFWIMTFGAVIVLGEGIFLILLNRKNSIRSLKEEMKDKKKELQETKQFLLENKNNITELIESQSKLREELLKRYKESLPVIQEDSEINKRILSLEQKEKKLED